jgi:hypothetical protein
MTTGNTKKETASFFGPLFLFSFFNDLITSRGRAAPVRVKDEHNLVFENPLPDH